MSAKTFVDTNVLVYAVDSESPAKQQRAHEILEQLRISGFVISAQVMQEFYVNTTRKLPRPLPPELALRALYELKDFVVVPTDADLVLEGIELAQRHQLSLWDALIVKSALAAGCTRLLTEDLQDGQRFGGLEIENPFRGL